MSAIDTSENVITIRDLYKSFGSLDILKGVDLDLAKGENLVVLGKSGTGKSVLIKIICGLLKADSGTVNVLGKEVGDLDKDELNALRTQIGFCFQNSALYDSMTIKENLEFPLKYAVGMKAGAHMDAEVDRVLEAVGLLQTKNQMPAELSGGQKKRIGIARTLIVNPKVILYDEPTAGLDPITCVEINDLINQIQKEYGASAIIITHDLSCARQTGDKMAILLDGVFTKYGTFDEVFLETDDPRIESFYDYNFIESQNTKTI